MLPSFPCDRCDQVAESFATLLCFLSSLLPEPSVSRALHIFFEPSQDAGTVRQEIFAFNSSGALWFSGRAFAELFGTCPAPVLEPSCTSFWFVTLLHELAHNNATGHNARHKKLMERMLENFLPALIVAHTRQVTTYHHQLGQYK